MIVLKRGGGERKKERKKEERRRERERERRGERERKKERKGKRSIGEHKTMVRTVEVGQS